MGSRPPFSRQPDRGGERDGYDLLRAVEFAAATYGWGPDYIELCLTDEQLVGIFDAAQDRLTDRSQSDFEAMLEAVRLGTVFAHDGRQYGSWRRSQPRRRGDRSSGLTGMALESAVMRIAALFPENVSRGTV